MKTRVWISMGVLALLVAGCILSAQETRTIEFVDVDTRFTNGLVADTVDLSDYMDNPEQIEAIEKVKIDAIVRNDLPRKDTIDVYVSANPEYATRSEVKAAKDVLPVLLGYITPAGPAKVDTLDVKEADKLLQLSGDNWTNVKTLLATGKFTAYVTSTGATAQGQIIKANIYLTITLTQ